LDIIKAVVSGGKLWEIPQSMYEGASKPRRWEVTERKEPQCKS
jgi:hypothetical protein